MAGITASVRANKPLAAVMRAMHVIAPLHLADRSWDNVGLLLEAPKPRNSRGVFLAIDLTQDVASELLSEKNKGISVAVIYHPTIFRGLKSLTLSNTQQQSLLRCAAEGISIYCPHTSLDATPAGINDWLILNALSASKGSSATSGSPAADRLTARTLADPRLGEAWALSPDTFLKTLWEAVSLSSSEKAVKVLTKSDNVDSDRAKSEGWTSAGMGRLLRLDQAVTLGDFVRQIKREVGVDHAQLALARGASLDTTIQSIAVCAGSGGSVLGGAKADLWITGELSHHELLATTEPGSTSVLLLRHSASERGFLADILAPRLRALLVQKRPEEDDDDDDQAGDDGKAAWDVVVSQEDRDPLSFV
ncbi:hypothetical protein V8E36_008677 [Tilletia maclaganii]